MIEITIRKYLADTLNIPVYMERPSDAPSTYCLLEKTGSSEHNRILSSTFAVQSYAPSLLGAAQLNESVKVAMDSIDTLDEIGSCTLNSDYNYTNASTKEYRYQAVFDLTHY